MEFKIDLDALKQADLARIFGKNERTIQRWHEQGLPRHGEGRGTTYVWAEVLPWYVAAMSGSGAAGPGDGGKGNLSYDQWIKKNKAETGALDLALKQKTLMLASGVREVWATECAAMRARLLSIPATAALKIDPSHTQAQREEMLRREIYEALESLSGDKE